MAHFAEIDSSNIVTRVLVVDDSVVDAQNFLADELGLGGTWIQTSFNTQGGVHLMGGTPLRKNFAGVGYSYDATRDAFIPPQPFPSWKLDEATCFWQAPIPVPTDDKLYIWNEASLSWESAPSA